MILVKDEIAQKFNRLKGEEKASEFMEKLLKMFEDSIKLSQKKAGKNGTK